MDVVARRGSLAARRDAVAVYLPEGVRRLGGAAASLDRATRGAVAALVSRGGFRGRFLESATIHPAAGPVARVIVVGLGPASALTPSRILRAAARAAGLAREAGVRSLGTALPDAGPLDPGAVARAVAGGGVLGAYRHTAYRSRPDRSRLGRVEIVVDDAARARSLAAEVGPAVAAAEATCLARDLARTPGDDLPPERLAERAAEVARGAGGTARVFDVAAMERLGMGAVLAVGRGSARPPRFVALEWPAAGRRGPGAPTVVLIGKGVTFDTGGISLKPRENMNRMKYDMSGAAAVIAVFSALPAIAPPLRVVGLIPSAENMPGGRALKPGDVVRALDGTTIEVTNTDAEGRLLLADALAYARRLEPDAVVDVATLTGAISIALGPHAAGLFTEDEALAASLLAAGEQTGERLWRMPVWDEYLEEMRGDVADLVNSSGAREGAANQAAGFLKHFAKGMRWAHLDIASTAWTPADRPHEPRGPNGFGARLLLDWLSRWGTSSGSRPARPSKRGRASARGRTSLPASRARGPARR